MTLADSVVDRLTIHKLRVFCRVVELGSVTRVADELYVAQPVISGHLRSLEDRLGVKLIYWDHRELKLTESGEVVHVWARSVLEQTRQMTRTIASVENGERGRVVVGASATPGTYLLPQILLPVRDTVPDAQVTLEVFEASRVSGALVEGHCDFVTVFAAVSRQQAETLEWTEAGQEDILLVARPDGGLPKEAAIADLAEFSFVCAPLDHLRRRHIDSLLSRNGLDSRKIAIELSHPESIKQAVAKGAGVSLIYRCVVQDALESGELVEIPITDARLVTPIYIGAHRKRAFTPVQQRVFDLVGQRLRALN